MSFEDYRLAWQATSASAPIAAEVDGFIRSMMRSERRSRMVKAACAVNAAAAFLLSSFVVLFRRPLFWNELLPVLGLQVVVTLALVVVIRRGQARRKVLEASGLTVREATHAGLAHVASEIRDLRFMAKLLWVVVPLLGISVAQLISSGKMDLQEAWSFALVVALVIGANIVIQWRRYRRTLAPSRERLEQVLASFQNEFN